MAGLDNGRQTTPVTPVENARRGELRKLLVGAAVAARNDRRTLIGETKQAPQPRVRQRVVLLLCGSA